MPCFDGRDFEDARRTSEMVTAGNLLCAYCKHLEKQKEEIPPFLSSWWKAHKLRDKDLGKS